MPCSTSPLVASTFRQPTENSEEPNFSYSTLCLNGDIDFGSRTLTTSGYGLTNFNGQLTGSGALVINGSTADPATGQGIVTLSGDNATTFTGAITVNSGQLVALSNGALGSTSAGTTINDGGTLTFRGGITTAEPLTLRGAGATLGRGDSVDLTRQAGALYNDGGDNTVSGAINLAANAAVGSRAGHLTLSGVISGTGSTLTKLGEGVVTLSNSGNTYSGPTRIEGGALRVTTETALPGGFATAAPSGGNLTLAGGVLEIGVGTTFTRSVGNGSDQVQWTGDGGFSAFGGNRTVTLSGGTLTWGSGSFVPTGNALLLSSDYADSTVTFTNALALGNQVREVRVADGSAAVDGALSGNISGSGGILKTGDGTLNLAGGTKNYTGATVIQGGALRGLSNASSNIQLAGGVLEINANYDPTLGTTGGQLRWTGSGGFAAESGDRRIRLGGSTNAVTWGTTANFLSADSELIFGSTSATGTIQFDSGINLGGGTRTIRVIDSQAPDTRAEARLTRAVSNGNLIIAGNGRLDSQFNNTALAGTVEIRGAELNLNGSNGRMTAVTGFEVRQGGTLTLASLGTHSSSTGGANQNDRIGNSATISLGGGQLRLIGDDGASTTETIGTVTLASGANTIDVARGADTRAAQLTSASLVRTVGSTVDFSNSTGGGVLGTSGNNPRAVFTAAPTQTNNILAYATVNGEAFATHGADGIAAAASADGAPWIATSNVTLDNVNGVLAGDPDRQVNSIRFTGSSANSVNLDGRNLDIVSGGILSAGSSTNTFTGAGNLTSSSGEIIAHVHGSSSLNIGVTIADSGSTSVGLTKSGGQTLTLSGTTANTFTGATIVNAGTLVLAKSPGVAALSGTSVTVGDGRGVDTLRLGANEQINDAATVTLRGGEVGNSANVARLELAGAADESFGSRIESFATLSITGNSVLDFGGGTPCSPTFLQVDLLSVSADSLLTITNWIEFTDFLLVSKTAFDAESLSRVIFDGYGGAASWKSYDSDYFQIVPYSPVPEPGTYGLLALGGLLGSTFLRRKKRPAAP